MTNIINYNYICIDKYYLFPYKIIAICFIKISYQINYQQITLKNKKKVS